MSLLSRKDYMKLHGLTCSNNQNRIFDLTKKSKIDIYDLCPCGSLKKYKFCCMKQNK